ncbi:flagellar hook-basal body protein [Nitrospira sp. Kam-Ns4a]
MDRGIYPILSGALAQEHRLHVLAHNVANLNTTGFKRLDPTFQSLVPGVAWVQPAAPIALGAVVPSWPTGAATARVFVAPREVRIDDRQGARRETKQPWDLAIEGPGFFEINTPAGLRYTRNGMFHLDPRRRLVTEAGDPVMGVNGEIQLKAGEVKVLAGGHILVNDEEVARIKVVEFPDPRSLVPLGGGLFAGTNPKPLAAPTVVPGQLEASNVNAFMEMVKLIEVMRAYEFSQKVMQTYDQMTGLAIQELGRVA